jgi:hypothetical protein
MTISWAASSKQYQLRWNQPTDNRGGTAVRFTGLAANPQPTSGG